MMSYQHPTIDDDDTAVPPGTTTHDKKERVVPSGMMMESPSSSSSPPSWKTKKAGVVLLGLLGLTAMVASGGAAPIFPSLGAVVLRREGSFDTTTTTAVQDLDKCVPASGPWPAGSVSQIKDCQHDENGSCGPYVTCFQFADTDKQCWSHSYYNNGDWDPCKPYASRRVVTTFGGGWENYSPMTARDIQYPKSLYGPGPSITVFTLEPIDSCGTACTAFDPDVPH